MSGITVRPVVGPAGDQAWAAVRERVGYPVPDDRPAEDARRLIAWHGTEPVGRIAFAVAEDLVGAPGRTGWVGWYEALDARAGVPLLLEARNALGAESVQRVIGPFHGSTWDRYRLAIRRGQSVPPFLGEPWNPARYPRDFERAGFASVAEYESRRVPPHEDDPGRASTARVGLVERGVRVRGFDPARFDEELRRIFELSLAAFASNRYYSPIGWERFRAIYTAIGPLIDPDLVFLAEADAGELLGFCFSYPDPLAEPGRPRVILKTLAVAPAARGLGLGGALTTLTQGVAAARGAAVIHALMEAGNPSRRISFSQGGKPFRTYVLYEAPGSI